MTDDGFQQIADAIRRASEDATPREDCPSPERIWGAVKRELPLKDRLEIIDHTTQCLVCAEAWRIAMTLGDRAAEHAFGRPRSSWMLTGALAASIMLAVAGLSYFLMWRDAQRIAPPMAQTTSPPQTAPPSTSAVIVALNDGAGRVTLTADGTLTTSSELAATAAERVKQALLTGKLASPAAMDDVKTGAGTLMGSADRGPASAPATPSTPLSSAPPTSSRTRPLFRVARPVGTMVEDQRPTLTWFPLAGALSYEVTISDVGANYMQVMTSPRLRETTWTVPTRLPRDRTYSWQVVAFTNEGHVKAPSPEQPEARFRVMSLEAADAVVQARIAHKDEHLVLGVTYAAAGLLEEAEAEFRALAAANPRSSVAADLLRSVREMREGRK